MLVLACMVSGYQLGQSQPRRIAEDGIEPSSFYGTPRVSRPSDAAGRSWLPGDVLPTRCECINDVNQLKESIHELITSMQTNILNEMNEVQQSLQLLSTRLTKSEADIAHLHVSQENIPSVETDSSSYSKEL